jgi:hypothetical protein
MTVANVRDDETGDVEVLFLESARFYRLPRAHPRFDELLALVQSARDEQRPVRVGVSSYDADRIEDVGAARAR